MLNSQLISTPCFTPALKLNPEFEHSLLALAWQQLRVHGLAALTMDSLAAQLRVSKKRLYQHFASKQKLVEAAFQQHEARYQQQLLTLLHHPAPGQLVWLQAVRQFHTELSSELSVSACQELLHRVPALWLSWHLFVHTAIQQLLDYQLQAAQASASRALGSAPG